MSAAFSEVPSVLHTKFSGQMTTLNFTDVQHRPATSLMHVIIGLMRAPCNQVLLSNSVLMSQPTSWCLREWKSEPGMVSDNAKLELKGTCPRL